MRTVFITGATGTMGSAGLRELLAHQAEFGYRIRVLARPGKKNRRLLDPLRDRIEVVWGSLTRYEDVLRGVEGSDIVLHVGGMVSPAADYRPQATRLTNVGAARNILEAVLAQEKQPAVVYIGSVAQMGDRRAPFHWGRAGDPLCVSPYDHYGVTKVMAERILSDPRLERWVSLRQSGILYPGILRNFDPIMFHVPVQGVLEWATVEDSGRLLERVCRPDVPASFWKRFYNIGSGAAYRLTNYVFESLLLKAVGCPPPEKIFRPQWFATRNFHGMWYLDGDVLEDYFHFRENLPVEEYFDRMGRSRSLPWMIRFARVTRVARLFPHLIRFVMGRLAHSRPHGTQSWIRSGDSKRVRACYGSREQWAAIPDWKTLAAGAPDACAAPSAPLDHGYDERKDPALLSAEDLRQAAAFRGGALDSATVSTGDWDAALSWRCAEGHIFHASPRQILLGGHWCPDCFPYPYTDGSRPARSWNWGAEACRNPFLAQLWLPLHRGEPDTEYGPDLFNDWENTASR